MKIIAPLILSVILCPFLVKAQNFSFSPANVIDSTYDAGEYASNKIDIVNNTADVLNLRWITLENSFLEDWGFSLCDLGSCYPTVPDSNAMDPTEPGGDAFFICHALFNDVAGEGELKLYVYEEGDFSGGDTVRFIYGAESTIGIDPIEQNPRIIFKENPVLNVLSISNTRKVPLKSIVVVSISGKEQSLMFDQYDNSIAANVSNLSSGVYFVYAIYDDGIIAFDKFVKP